jgi:hypothetical protein
MKNAGIRARCWLGRIQGALQLVTWQWLTAATDARCENAPKVDIKRPFEIRIVAKFSTFYGKYGHFPHRFTHFYRTQVSLVRSMGPVLSHYVCMRRCCRLN